MNPKQSWVRTPTGHAASSLEVLRVFLQLGCRSFGGPIAHLGYFRSELVEGRRWCSEETFAELIAVSQSLPGPSSSQVAFAMGILRTGWMGGLAAWIGFTLPSALLMLGFAFAQPSMDGRFGKSLTHGFQLAAVAIVGHAVLTMRKSLAPDLTRLFIAAVAMAITLFVPMNAATLIAVLWGAISGLVLDHSRVETTDLLNGVRIPSWMGNACLVLCVLLFLLSLWANGVSTGPGGFAAAIFMAGSLVFGGGHVVLPLLEHSVVQRGWVTPQNLVAGYGAAQAVPGPVFTFAAYLGAQVHSSLPRVAMGGIALVSIFLPGMLLMVFGLTYWSRLQNGSRTKRISSGINASVVGVLAAAFIRPVSAIALHSWMDIVIAAACMGLLATGRLRPLATVLTAVLAALLFSYAV